MAKSVLIAESNKIFSEAMADCLLLLDFVVVGTTSKKSVANALALEMKPDLLIYNGHLSGDDAGFSDLQHLKEQLPEMKIIVLGYDDLSNEVMGTFSKAGFDGYWNKYDSWAGLLKQLKILFP